MKIKTSKKALTYLMLAIALFSCHKRTQSPSNKFDQTDSSSIEMMKLNQLLVDVEQKEIKGYIDTCSLKFNYVQTGYWIAKTKQGTGKSIKEGDAIEIEYQIETLAGKKCYTYTDKLKKHLVIGKLEKQRGFDEGLSSLKEGDQATFIIPSNLAFGVMGDMRSIPPRATLIYRVFSIKHK